MPLISQHLESLRLRSIDAVAALANKLSTASASGASAAIFGPESACVHGDAIRIPYHDIDGQPCVGDDGVIYERFRVFDTRKPCELVRGEHLQRYLARPGCGTRPYIPAGFASVAAGAPFVIVTEGEFKAISATAAGLPTLAIAGVTMWAQKTGGTLSAATEVQQDLLAALKYAAGIIVLADSDARGNANVQHAMTALADAISIQTGRPAVYAVVPEGDKTQGKKAAKQGLDDWITAAGADTVTKYLSWLWAKETRRLEVLAAGGYFPLGFNGETNFVWSIRRQMMFGLSASTLTQPGTLMNLAGGMGWCEAAYGKPTRGGALLVDWQSMGGDIASACVSAGPFDPSNCSRSGVWHVGGGVLVVNSADHIFRTDGAPVERFGGSHVFPTGRRLGLQSDTPQATAGDVDGLWDALRTWRFKTTGDSLLCLGWTLYSFLAGAVSWRAHLSLTGARGTGKSRLQELTGNILGRAVVQCDGDSTPAGIRQHVGSDALALLIDEAEADGKKIAGILAFLRSASSGAEVLRGTPDQAGTCYALRVSGMVAGIVPPMLNAADQSRFICLELQGVNAEAAADPHPLVSDTEAAQELGLRVFSRMVHAFPRLQRTQKTLRRHVGGDPRYADTVAPVLAAAWVGLSDDEMTDDDAAQFVLAAELDAGRSRATEAQDEKDAIDHLLSKLVDLQLDAGNTRRMTGAEALALALDESRQNARLGEHNKALGRHGLRVAKDGEHGTMLVSTKSPQLRGLFKDTKWEAGDLAAVLRRLPGAYMAPDSWFIGGSTCRPVAIPLPRLADVVPSVMCAAALA